MLCCSCLSVLSVPSIPINPIGSVYKKRRSCTCSSSVPYGPCYIPKNPCCFYPLFNLCLPYGPYIPFIYQQQNLDSDIQAIAIRQDPNIINPAGLTLLKSCPPYYTDIILVCNRGTGRITSYDLYGNALPLIITVPNAQGTQGHPSGIVVNQTPFFPMTNSTLTLPALLLICTEDGTINAYNPQINPSIASVVVNASDNNSFYKSLTVACNLLYAVDIFNQNIDVYDQNFLPVSSIVFNDPSIPSTYAPFGITNLENLLIVTYVLQSSDGTTFLPGIGNGYIDIYYPTGVLVKRFASNGTLNAPNNVVIVDGLVYVGNSGDGSINVFNPNGVLLGNVKDLTGNNINLQGLYGLLSVKCDHAKSLLYFTADLNNGADGLFGRLYPAI
jgi:uncharacterized protein (TIGR03118 family)